MSNPLPPLVALGVDHIDEILALEQASFAPPLQATAELIRLRLGLGHTMFGMRAGRNLVGMIAFARARFSPNDFASFPKCFSEFSTVPPPASPNAIFIYNLEVLPESRGGRVARTLVHAAINSAVADRLAYAVADGRVTAYNGSEPCSQERMRRKESLHGSLDRYLAGGPYPKREELLSDPTLALYHRLTGCNFHWIIPNFFPEDRAAGGIRVILYGALSTWSGRSPAVASAARCESATSG